MALSIYNLAEYTGPLADISLLCVLCLRGRWKIFPMFTALIVFDLAYTVGNAVWKMGSSFSSYALADAISVFLQLAVIVEVLRRVIPKSSKLAARGVRIFNYTCLAGLILAAGASFLFSPPAMHGPVLFWTRVDIFTGLLVCETVIAIMLAAQQIGMGWRNHLIAIAQGLIIWALSLVFVEGVGPYLNLSHQLYYSLYYVRSIVYVAILGYWSVALWREEPARKPISPALRKYIVALHDQVHYDLGKTGH